MSTDFGAWLRAQREDRGWSRSDTARRIIASAKEAGESGLPSVDTLRKSIYRWEAGQVEVSEKYRLLYCRVLSIKPAQFGPQTDLPPGTTVTEAAAVTPPAAGVPYSVFVAYRGIEAPQSTQSTVRHEVLMAAHEGSEHAEQAERRDFGDATLEQLHADIVRLSAELMTSDPFAIFQEMRRVRERLYRLLEGHLRPGDHADLYFLIGCLNDLMAVPASGLGYPQAAAELIRAGWAYAESIGNHPLMAHMRLQLASIMLWDGQPRRARDLAQDGLRHLASGPNGVNLHLKYAQAAARTGDAEGARRAIAAAGDARDLAQTEDDVAAIGGEFGLSAATEHYFAGSALVLIDNAENEAAARLEQALSLYEAGPRAGEQHWFGAKAMAGIDLAAVRLRSGALDAAAAAIEPALTLPSARRINSLMSRLQLVRTELAAPRFRGSAQAQELDEQIEDFGRDSVTAGLHALPGGPA